MRKLLKPVAGRPWRKVPLALLLILVPALPGHAQSRAEISERLLGATIRVENGGYYGSAALVHSERGEKKRYRYYVAGAEHTVNEKGGVTTHLYKKDSDETEGPFPLHVLGSDKGRDVFFGYFEHDRRLPTIPLSRLIPEAGFRAMYCGCSSGRPRIRSVRVERRDTIRNEGTDQLVWVSEASGQKGDSGGPLISPRGHLIGVVSGASKSRTYFSDLEPLIGLMKQRGYSWLYLASPAARDNSPGAEDPAPRSDDQMSRVDQLRKRHRELLRRMERMRRDLALKQDLGSLYWFRLGFLAREIERVRRELERLGAR